MNSKFSPGKNAWVGRNSPVREIRGEIGETGRLEVLAAGAQFVDRPPACPDQRVVLGLGEAARIDPVVRQADEEVALAGVPRLPEQVERAVAGGDLRADGDIAAADLLLELPATGGDVVLAGLQAAPGMNQNRSGAPSGPLAWTDV